MKRVILSATLLLWSASTLFAQIINPDVNIRFYNKKIYTPDSAVEILVELENKTENPIAFLSADNKIYNIKVKAATLQGVLCEPSDLYLKTMAVQEPYQYKEIILQPDRALQRLPEEHFPGWNCPMDFPGNWTRCSAGSNSLT